MITMMKKIMLLMAMIMVLSFGSCFAQQVQVSDEGAENMFTHLHDTMFYDKERNHLTISSGLNYDGKTDDEMYDVYWYRANDVLEMFWVNGAGYVSVIQIVTDAHHQERMQMASRMYMYTLNELHLTYEDVRNAINLKQVSDNMACSTIWSNGANRYIHTLMFAGTNTFQYMIVASDNGNADR